MDTIVRTFMLYFTFSTKVLEFYREWNKPAKFPICSESEKTFFTTVYVTVKFKKKLWEILKVKVLTYLASTFYKHIYYHVFHKRPALSKGLLCTLFSKYMLPLRSNHSFIIIIIVLGIDYRNLKMVVDKSDMSCSCNYIVMLFFIFSPRFTY